MKARDVDELHRIINGLHAFAHQAAAPAGRLNSEQRLSAAGLVLIGEIQQRVHALALEFSKSNRDTEKPA